MPNDYHTQTELERTRRLRELLHELPSCCSDYFIAIEQQTSALTRLSYAYDLKLFFQYLSAELPKFGGKPIVEFTIADIQQVTKQDLERYARYLALYIKNETLDDGEINSHEMTNHEFLTNDGTVQKSTFSSGMSVVVNFSEEKEYTSDSISVKPWDYTILDKDGKMTAKNGNVTDSSKTKTEIMPKWGLAAVLAGMFALIGFTVAGAIVYI